MNKVSSIAALFFLCLAPIGLTATPEPAPGAAAPGDPPPNILILLLDDVGVEQIECFDPDPAGSLSEGGSNYHGIDINGAPPVLNSANTYEYAATPNITRLAERGVRFTRAFTSPICTPSRASLMTGRYPCRNTIGHIVTPTGWTSSNPPVKQFLDMPLSEVTLPEMIRLSPHDYATAYFAKWHLSRHPEKVTSEQTDALGDDHPVLSGWDFYQGILQNPLNPPRPDTANYESWIQVTSIKNPAPGPPSALTSTVEISGEFITTRQRKDLEAWIVAQEGPWLAVWAATACHSPFNKVPFPSSLYSVTGTLDSLNEWNMFRAYLEAFDTELGNLETNLDLVDTDIWDNTIVLFMGDNGTDRNAAQDAISKGEMPTFASTPVTFGSNGDPYRFKATPHLTGTNVPFIAAGDFVTTPGRVDESFIDIVDVWTTVRELAEVDDASPEYATLMGGATIDGLSFDAILDESGGNGRTFSLALDYRPNGAFASRDAHRIAYTTLVGGNLYRLIRVRYNTSNIVPSPMDATDEFYLIKDSSGDLVDPTERTSDPTGADYTTMSAELDSILGGCL